MNTLSALALMAGAGTLLALPFLPALREWRRPSDTTPLRVVREHDSDIRSFAQRLRAWVSLDLGEALALAAQPDAKPVFVAWNGDPFVVLPQGHDAPMQGGQLTHGVVALGPWSLAAGGHAPKEVWCADDVHVGQDARLRALVSEGSVWLDEGAIVDRWLDAEGALHAARGVQLGRRAASQQAILLGPEVGFERLQAPCIETTSTRAGAGRAGAATETVDPQTCAQVDTLGLGSGSAPPEITLPPWWPQVQWLDDARRHARIKGPVTVPPGMTVPCHLVVEGDLTLAAGSQGLGAVKATGRLVAEAGARLTGAAFGMGGIDMAARSWCAGPLVSEGPVRLDEHVQVGEPDRPTTVSAGTLLLRSGVRIHGSIWVRQGGRTDALRTTEE